jgi:glutamate racemase
VPLVENGRFSDSDAISVTAVREYLEDIIPAKPAAVILGCTHYPLLSGIFAKYLPQSTLINSAEEATVSLCGLIKQKNLDAGKSGTRTFFVSDDPENFAKIGRLFLGRDISDRVIKTNIEEY